MKTDGFILFYHLGGIFVPGMVKKWETAVILFYITKPGYIFAARLRPSSGGKMGM